VKYKVFIKMNYAQFLVDPLPLLVAWLAGAFFSIIVPLRKWKSGRDAYYHVYGAYNEYEQQQRMYEEAQNQNQNQQNYNGYYDQDGNWNSYDNNYNKCHWWQFQCRRNQHYWQQAQMQNGEGDDRENNRMYVPWWYDLLGGKQMGEDRERENEMMEGQDDGAIKFVYWWLLVLFLAMIGYGVFILIKQYRLRRNPSTASMASSHHILHLGIMLALLFLFMQFALVSMITMCQGVITTDDRDMERSIYGWYGQWGVLIVYTCGWYFFYSLAFLVVFGIRMLLELHRTGSLTGMPARMVGSCVPVSANDDQDPSSDFKVMADGDRVV